MGAARALVLATAAGAGAGVLDAAAGGAAELVEGGGGGVAAALDATGGVVGEAAAAGVGCAEVAAAVCVVSVDTEDVVGVELAVAVGVELAVAAGGAGVPAGVVVPGAVVAAKADSPRVDTTTRPSICEMHLQLEETAAVRRLLASRKYENIMREQTRMVCTPAPLPSRERGPLSRLPCGMSMRAAGCKGRPGHREI